MQYKACLPLIAEIESETTSSVSYKANSGKAIAKLQTVQVKQNREMITEYGDDGVAEQISIFKDGDITLGTTFVPKECEPIMFGNTASTETVGTGNDAVTVPVLVDKDDDLGDYTGFGFIWAELQNGTKVYHLMWIYKVRWTQPDDDYETNAPYSLVAKRLNVPQTGVNSNILLSSTGFMYRATDWIAAEGKPTGSFLDNIIGGTFTQNGETVTKTPVDLSDYDYLMLHFFKDDLNKIPIGDANSTAVTDEALADYDAALTAGTLKLAGGVMRLVQYLNENYPHCRLILVGAPPVDTDIVPGGNPFAKTYTGSGVSQTSDQLDTLMHTLAEREKFVYIDWQGLKLSYYYQKYTGATVDGTKINNVHANNDNTYRQMGEYLAEHI